jgi:hypothetical protein
VAALVSRSAKVRLSAAVIGGLLNVQQAAFFLVVGHPLLAALSVAAVALFGLMAALLLRGHLRLGCWLGYLVIAGHVLFMTSSPRPSPPA